MAHRRHVITAFISALALAACSPQATTTATTPTIGVNVAAMDTSVSPGGDFYNYANGAWQRTTEIPADRSGISSSYGAFLATEAHNRELIDGILASHPAAGTDQARIANFYNAYTNTQAINAAGMSHIQPDIARFQAISDKTALSTALGGQIRADVDPFNATNFQTENLFGIFVTQSLGAPAEVLPYILQGGLGMPERDYYLSSDAHMASLRTAYKAYIEQIFTLAGIDDAKARAQRVYDLEMRIARAHNTREQSENLRASATVWTRAELEHNAPGIDWGAFLNAAQLGSQPRFAAYHAHAITGLSALVASQPLQAWKDWLVFHQINMHSDVMPTAIDHASFAFYGTTMSGTPQQRERPKRALASLNIYLGDAVGHAYVDRYFPASARAEVQTMVTNIKAAFANRIRALTWMAPSTRDQAVTKAEGIVVGVGYPDAWRDYSRYDVSADNAYANEVNGSRIEYAHQLAKIGHPLDRNEWWMNPQTVNAVNLPVQNALNFPAGILQPPFFDPSADPAFNYGAIGAVIGHEISHSFDNSGADFDATGALRNWWTPADRTAFERQGKALADQYSTYEPLPGLHVNGPLTLGENLADVAGLQAALDAYHASLNGQPAPVINGLTGDQRFFIAYAQTWSSKLRDAAMRQRIATDGHAPGMYRALTVRNLDAWYAAFNVQPTDALYLPPEKRVHVW
ncbi:MAG: M13 family metallopeptidase [Pseudomonadota bacterium]